MPGTFRGFLQGLGVGLPKVAEAIWNWKQAEMAEERLGMEKKRVGMEEERLDIERKRFEEIEKPESTTRIDESEMRIRLDNIQASYLEKVEEYRIITERNASKSSIYNTSMLELDSKNYAAKLQRGVEKDLAELAHLKASTVSEQMRSAIDQITMSMNLLSMQAQLDTNPELWKMLDGKTYSSVQNMVSQMTKDGLPPSFVNSVRGSIGPVMELFEKSEEIRSGAYAYFIGQGKKHEEATILSNDIVRNRINALAPVFKEMRGIDILQFIPNPQDPPEVQKGTSWLNDFIKNSNKILSDPAPFGPQAKEGFQEIGQGVKNIYGGATQEPGGDPYRYGRF